MKIIIPFIFAFALLTGCSSKPSEIQHSVQNESKENSFQISSLKIVSNQAEETINSTMVKKLAEVNLKKTFQQNMLTVKSIPLDYKGTMQSFAGHPVLFINFSKPVTLHLQNKENPTVISNSIIIDLQDKENNIIAIQNNDKNVYWKFSIQDNSFTNNWIEPPTTEVAGFFDKKTRHFNE